MIMVRAGVVWSLAVAAGLVGHAAAGDCGGCGAGLAGTPADEFIAHRLGLVREWVVQLPFDSARARLEHVVVGDGLVVAQTGDGGVHAVKAAVAVTPAAAPPGAPAVGSLLWSRRFGAPGGPTTKPGIGPRLVTVARDMEVIAVDRETGAARWQTPLGVLPGGGAVEVGDWVYAPLAKTDIRRLTYDPLQPTAEGSAVAAPPPEKTAPAKARDKAGRGKAAQPSLPKKASLEPRTIDAGGRVTRPPRPLGDGVAWTTTDGILVALTPATNGWDREEFALHAPAVDAPLTRGEAVFVATQAADLARVDRVSSPEPRLQTGWHVVLDAIPDAGPFLGGDAVVVSLGESGLAAFSATTGAALWRSPVAGQVLAVCGDRIWIIDRTGRLAGIDLSTGERRERHCLGGLSFPIVNADSDRLLLASPDGLLVSLAPRRPPPAPEPQEPGPVPGEQAPPPAEAAAAGS